MLAEFGEPGKPEPFIPPITQETLAELVGTTRARVSFFMNRFRKLGLIEYNGRIRVHKALLNVILHDHFTEQEPRVNGEVTGDSVQEPAQDVVIETQRETSRLGQSMHSIKRDQSAAVRAPVAPPLLIPAKRRRAHGSRRVGAPGVRHRST